MLREAQLDHLDHLIDAYSALSVYNGRSEELELLIEEVFVESAESDPTFSWFQAITGASSQPHKLAHSRAAWVLQHALKCRAFNVRSKIVQVTETTDSTEYSSPMVDQLGLINFSCDEVDLKGTHRLIGELKARKTLDCVLLDRARRAAYPVVSMPNSQVKSLMKRNSLREVRPSLFAKSDAEVVDIAFCGHSIATLLVATDVLRAAAPQYTVTPLAIVLDDHETGWGFQAHDMSSMLSPQIPQDIARTIWLDDYPIYTSSRLMRESGFDVDEFDLLPSWRANDSLNNLPVDRSARCHMALNCMWELQSAAPGRLVELSWNEIGDLVQRRYKIVYSTDNRRHDVEDCLERSGHLYRLTYDSSKFSLTPRGVARAILTRRLLSPMTTADDDHGIAVNILAHIADQAKLIAIYRNGDRH